MMQQYRSIKSQHPDKVIFFRLGDFYEMFAEDALQSAPILQITLTERHGIAMCGIPHHQLHNYAYKLLQLDHKIAVVEQTNDPESDSGIFKREVVRILTPGTVIDSHNLRTTDNNFIVSLFWVDDQGSSSSQNQLLLSELSAIKAASPAEDIPQVVFGALDISTGENEIVLLKNRDKLLEEISTLLLHYNPKEVLIREGYRHYFEKPKIDLSEGSSSAPATITQNSLLKHHPHLILNTLSDKVYSAQYYTDIAVAQIKEAYGLATLKKTNMNNYSYEGVVLYTLIHYVKENCRDQIRHLKFPKIINQRDYLILDQVTQKNLELVQNNQDASADHTLLKTIGHTQTSIGQRKLKNWLLRPLLDRAAISRRQDNIEFFYNHPTVLNEVRSALKKVCDLERYCARLAMNRIAPREINHLKESLKIILQIRQWLLESEYQQFHCGEPEAIMQMVQQIETTLLSDPANNLSHGGVIVSSFNKELEKYNFLKQNTKDSILKLEQEEQRLTGNTKIKIKYTEASGYFIEVTKANLSHFKKPERYIKKQSLMGGDRFVTEKLLRLQDRINLAQEHSITLEQDIFRHFKESLIVKIPLLQRLAEQVAELDVFCSFAHLALTKNYTKPSITDGNMLEIVDGWHPIVAEEMDEDFIVNSISIGDEDNQLHLITGPNMSGKSTFLRQIALSVILAQMGGWLPCSSAKMGICDRVFTRIGASDNISQGESTFLVEMSETANILYHCTDRSFIIMDEIGRGTSTYDGLSLAWAIIEYLVTTEGKRAKTLFATHYHELTRLAEHFSAVNNFHVSVMEEENNLYFLKKIMTGAAIRSYGIHVAKIAGLPNAVIHNAQNIAASLEDYAQHQINGGVSEVLKREAIQTTSDRSPQTDNEEQRHLSWMKDQISAFDIAGNRPLDALNAIAEMQRKLERNNGKIL